MLESLGLRCQATLSPIAVQNGLTQSHTEKPFQTVTKDMQAGLPRTPALAAANAPPCLSLCESLCLLCATLCRLFHPGPVNHLRAEHLPGTSRRRLSGCSDGRRSRSGRRCYGARRRRGFRRGRWPSRRSPTRRCCPRCHQRRRSRCPLPAKRIGPSAGCRSRGRQRSGHARQRGERRQVQRPVKGRKNYRHCPRRRHRWRSRRPWAAMRTHPSSGRRSRNPRHQTRGGPQDDASTRSALRQARFEPLRTGLLGMPRLRRGSRPLDTLRYSGCCAAQDAFLLQSWSAAEESIPSLCVYSAQLCVGSSVPSATLASRQVPARR